MPVGVAGQRIAAADDLGVDGGHDEGCGPRAEIRIVFGHRALRPIEPVTLALGVQAIGIIHDLPNTRVQLALFHHVQHAGHGPAAEAAPHTANAGLDLGGHLAVTGFHFPLHTEHAYVRRYAVEPAGVDDPNPGPLGTEVMGIDHAAHPVHLAGQIAVVGRPADARGNQLAAV